MTQILSPSGTRGFTPPRAALALFKATGGLMNGLVKVLGDRMKIQGQHLLVLTTVGAKTGRRRQVALARFADPDHPGSWLVIGSGGGSARHPAWCHNLVANPSQVSIWIAGNEVSVDPTLLDPVERDKAWDMVVSLAPGYARYEKNTDRQIPIFRLTPVVG